MQHMAVYENGPVCCSDICGNLSAFLYLALKNQCRGTSLEQIKIVLTADIG